MSGNAHKVGRRSQASKPDLWYYDRLPATARAALANAERDWSSAWIYNAWNKARPGYKTGPQCAVQIAIADKRRKQKAQ